MIDRHRDATTGVDQLYEESHDFCPVAPLQ
jgi:hypothetical protein